MYTSYKAHPTRQHLAYTKGRGTEVNRPDMMYHISMHSNSPKSWVFNKPDNSNIQHGTINIPQYIINQDEAETVPQQKEPHPQGKATTKTNLQILQCIHGPVKENGNINHLAESLKKGELMGASDGMMKDGKRTHV